LVFYFPDIAISSHSFFVVRYFFGAANVAPFNIHS